MQEHQPAAHVCFGRNPTPCLVDSLDDFRRQTGVRRVACSCRVSEHSQHDPHAGLADPFVSGMVAWDLGHDWGFSYMLGAYIEVNSPVAYSSSSLNQRFVRI